MQIRFTFLFIFLLCHVIGLKAEKHAVLDLRETEETDHVIELKGYWEFYWLRNYESVKDSTEFLTPELVPIPNSWTLSGHPSHGFGTYHYKILVSSDSGSVWGIKLFSAATAYNIYINGAKRGSAGKFSTLELNGQPDYQPRTYYFECDNDTIDIAIEISNYNYRQGGIWISPEFGKAASLKNKNYSVLILNGALMGALFIMLIYFLSFYMIRRSEKSVLYFALVCLAAMLRIGSTGEILFRQMNLPISWLILIKIEYMSLVMLMFFGLLYLVSLFKDDVNKRVMNVFVVVHLIAFFFFLFSEIEFASTTIPSYLIFCGLEMVFLTNIMIKVIIQKKPHANYIGAGFAVLILFGINDMLYSQLLINSTYLIPVGIFLFIFIETYALTRKFSIAFEEVENLSDQLQAINKNQEQIIHDRTALLEDRAVELKKISNIKDRVFSIISHDLRAPIKSLASVLNFAEDKDITLEELIGYLRGIRKNVESLDLTLENLLNWSKAELAGIQNNPEIIDIRHTINQVFELFRIQAAEKGVILISEIRDRALVYIDPNHLNLLMRNLVNNAIKFSHSGGKVTISAKYTENHTLKVCVADEGVGISKENLVAIFDPAQHLTTYGTSNEKGTGLGLLLCKEYIESNHGQLTVESEPGKGTKIFFTIQINP